VNFISLAVSSALQLIGRLQRHGSGFTGMHHGRSAAVASRMLEEIGCSVGRSPTDGRVASILCKVSFGNVGIARTASQKLRSSISFFTHASRSRYRQSLRSLASRIRKRPYAGKSSSNPANGKNVRVTAAQPTAVDTFHLHSINSKSVWRLRRRTPYRKSENDLYRNRRFIGLSESSSRMPVGLAAPPLRVHKLWDKVSINKF